LRLEIDKRGSLLDATIARASGCGGLQRGLRGNALGRSRGGRSTKLHAVVELLGRPRYVELTPGQQHEATVAASRIARAEGKTCIADAGGSPS
jgi:hypothetical protein